MYSYVSVSVNGTTQQFEGTPLVQTPLVVALVLGVSLLAVILSTLLTFFTNIVIGGLASAMTTRREFAYLGSIALRLVLSAVVLGLVFLVALLVSGNLESAALLFGMVGLGQGVTLLASASVPFNILQIVFIVVCLVAAQIGVLFGVFRLTIWRANQA